MSHGFRRPHRVLLIAAVGLCGLMVSCSGAGPQRAVSQASGGTAGGGAVLAATAEPRLVAMHVDDSFDAPKLERQFEAVARRVIPSVVAISAVDTPVASDEVQHPGRTNPDRLNAALESIDRTVGTGLVVDPDGYIVTNEHVVGRASQIWVTTDDRKVYPAVVVGSDPRSDLAVLKIPAKGLQPVTFAKGEVRRGQWTMAIGNPYGLAGDGELAVSVGVVSAVGRSLPKLSGREDRLYQDLIQTTAQINPGNSGGPLFDLAGHVIGVNCAVILPVKQTNGIGFALPLNTRVRSIIDRLRSGREVTYAYLGVRTTTATEADLEAAGLPDAANGGGAKVDFVESGSPAEQAKLKVGDVITSLAGERITESEQFIRAVGDCPVGPDVAATVHRSGKPVTITLKLRPREVAAAPVTTERQRFFWRGLMLGTAAQGGGVIVLAIDAKSPLAGQVKQGDLIESVGGVLLKSVPGILDALARVPMEQCAVKVAAAPSPVVSVRE